MHVPVVKFYKFLATQSQCRYNKGVLKIHNHVRQVKASEEIGVKFMQRWEEEAMWKREGREACLAEGLAEGLNKGQTINPNLHHTLSVSYQTQDA